MIIGVGIDLVRISRVRKLAGRFSERIGQKVFTPDELAHCRAEADPGASLAGRFAVKEAVMKALGTGWRAGVRFIDIEVVRSPGSQASISLHGKVSEAARARGITAWQVSISHDGDLAMAAVIAEGKLSSRELCFADGRVIARQESSA